MASELSLDPGYATLVIPKFEKYQVNQCYNTSYFYIGSANHCFYLTVYPHGFNERTKDYVSVWLRKHSKDEMLLDFKCSVLNDREAELYSKCLSQQHLSLESALGWTTFCRRHMIVDQRNEALKDGKLTLKCTFTIKSVSAIPNAETEFLDPSFSRSLLELSSNFQSMYAEKIFSDYSIKIGAQSLGVHKAILSARSPVFKEMFSKPAIDNKISDLTEEAVVDMLDYIYTGRLSKLTTKRAHSLYYAANKYGLSLLRQMCSQVLGNNLTTNNVIEILLLSYKHSDSELLDLCLCFVDKHLRNIKGRREWIDLMKSHPDLANRAIFFQAEA